MTFEEARPLVAHSLEWGVQATERQMRRRGFTEVEIINVTAAMRLRNVFSLNRATRAYLRNKRPETTR